MTLAELVQEFRYEAFDLNEDYLWPNERVTYFINQAERDACQRSQLLIDSTTSSCCDISIEIDTREYSLATPVHKVLSVYDSEGRQLIRDGWSRMRLDREVPDWKRHEGKAKLAFQEGKTLVVYPLPTVAEDWNMTVWRKPLVALAWSDIDPNDGEPEIPERYHEALVWGALSRAFRTRDSDAYHEQGKSANYYEGLFTQIFGPKPSATQELGSINQRIPIVQMIQF